MMQLLFWILAAIFVLAGVRAGITRKLRLTREFTVKGLPAGLAAGAMLTLSVVCTWASFNTTELLRIII